MIKANELRIGNRIFSKQDNAILNVVQIDDLGCVIENENGNRWIEFEYLYPVQITEELILMSGFEKLTSIEKGFKSNSYTYSRGFSFIVHLNNGLLSTNFWQGNEKKYVHQLQNLFFALTGEELVFQLSHNNCIYPQITVQIWHNLLKDTKLS